MSKRVLAVGRVQTQVFPGFRTQLTFHVFTSHRFEGESVEMSARQIPTSEKGEEKFADNLDWREDG